MENRLLHIKNTQLMVFTTGGTVLRLDEGDLSFVQ